MLWLLNKKLLDNNIIFYQLFNSQNSYNLDNNIIYNLDNNDKSVKIPFTEYKNIKINFEIKIMGNIIMYKNIDTSEIFTFTKKETCCKSNNLVLQHEYKLVDNHKLPNLPTSFYDYYYNNIEFDIYYTDINKMFIIQINKLNNLSTNYFIQNLI
jgi:hypothetical protein